MKVALPSYLSSLGSWIRAHGLLIIALIIIACMSWYIYFLQVQVDELRRHVESAYDFSNHDSFDYRITNLEHISNSHGDRLKDLETDTWRLNGYVNRLNWRTMQLEWATPSVTVHGDIPKEEAMPNFNSNPGNVPWPSFPNNDIYIHPGDTTNQP